MEELYSVFQDVYNLHLGSILSAISTSLCVTNTSTCVMIFVTFLFTAVNDSTTVSDVYEILRSQGLVPSSIAPGLTLRKPGHLCSLNPASTLISLQMGDLSHLQLCQSFLGGAGSGMWFLHLYTGAEASFFKVDNIDSNLDVATSSSKGKALRE